MNLARFSVSRPVTAGIISVALFFVGLFYLYRLPVSLWPNISFPFVSILVPYPGATPEQIEARVVKPLEASLAGIKGLKKITAQSRFGYAFLILEFRLTVNEREALESTRERVAASRGEFPEDTKEPVVRRVDVGASPILTFGIETQKSPAETRKILEDGLIQVLQRVEGVNEAKIVGVGADRLEFALDASSLSALKVAPLDLFEAIRARLTSIPWGKTEQSGIAQNIAAGIASDDPSTWNQETITLQDGRIVRLNDVGNVTRTTDSEASTVHINGKAGLSLIITKRADANTVATVKAVRKALHKFELPSGIRLFSIVDQSLMIKENEHEVWIALFAGGIFAVIIIFLFLTDVKSALISATALPVSVVGTFIFFNMLGFSINMLTLLALALAIGLLIDDAVVVREAIYAEMEHGYRGAEAAVRGTDRVASAVLATTLAIVAVFIPVAMMGGMVGQFFREFGLTIVVATLLSMWVAFTLDPMLSAKFAGTPSILQGKFWQRWRVWMQKTDEFFAKLADRAFRQPFIVGLLTALVLITGIGLTAARGADFLSFEDRGQFVLSLKSWPGTTRSDFQEIVIDAGNRLRQLPGLTDMIVTEGGDQASGSAEYRLLFVAKTERKQGLLTIIQQAREQLKDLKADWLILDPPPFEGAGMQAPVMVSIYGNDLDALDREAKAAFLRLKQVKGIADARIDTATRGPALDVKLNRGEIGYSATNARAVEATGRLALTGLDAGTVGDDNISFFMRLQPSDRSFEKVANALLVPSARGPQPMYRLADVKPSSRSSAIDREQRSRAVILWATLDRSRTLDQVLSDVKKDVIEKVKSPMTAAIAGDAEIFEEMLENFAIALVAALFFIFVILSAQFENLLRPFIIILSLPLASIGAFLGLFITGHQLALGSIIGIIFLMGLAAKNGILLVDAIGKKEKTGSLKLAVVDSVRERCRPILMTSAAMIAGMIPTAVMRGSGSEFRSPMAISIIGGVISSTFLSLVVIPAIFGGIYRWQKRRMLPGSNQKKTDKTSALSAKAMSTTSLLIVAMTYSPQARTQTDPIEQAFAIVGQIPGHEQSTFIRSRPHDASEYYKQQAIDTSVEAARDSSWLAFVGGFNISASRQWARPGISQDFTLPLPPELGGPVTSSNILLPRQKDEITIGAKLPIFNMQAIHGLHVAKALEEQRAPQRAALDDEQHLANAQTLLEYSASRETVRVLKDALKIAETRYETAHERHLSGTISRIDLLQAEAGREQARLTLIQASSNEERLKNSAEVRTGQTMNMSAGLPSYSHFVEPSSQEAAQQIPAVLRAIEYGEQSQAAAKAAQDAVFYPTLGVGLARQYIWYKGFNVSDPQNVLSLELNWTLLDGGSRRRAVADAERQRLELTAQRRQLEDRFREVRNGYSNRLNILKQELQAALSLKDAALKSQSALQSAWEAGLIALDDVRKADDQVLRSRLGIVQSLVSIQALALEQLMATGKIHNLAGSLSGT